MKALIIDDERLARLELRRLLEPFPSIEIVGEASHAEEARVAIQEHQPEIIFLDIQMPGKTGFELLESLEGYIPEVIFTTAYDEFAVKAFEFNALDYLLKPIDPQRLAETLQKIKPPNNNNLNIPFLTEKDQIFIKDGEDCWFVRLNKVRLFESEGNYVKVFFEDNKPMIIKTLNQLEEKLDPTVFFRANRKHLINLNYIESIEPWFSNSLLLTLTDGQKIEISRRQTLKFKELRSL